MRYHIEAVRQGHLRAGSRESPGSSGADRRPSSEVAPSRDSSISDDSFCLVATVDGHPDRVVSAAQVCPDPTYYRGEIANLQGVATHPEHLRHGLATVILCRLFHYAAHRWGATRVEWICEDVPERVRACGWYMRTFHVDEVPGTNCMFRIPFPWTPPPRIAHLYVDHFSSAPRFVPAVSR